MNAQKKLVGIGFAALLIVLTVLTGCASTKKMCSVGGDWYEHGSYVQLGIGGKTQVCKNGTWTDQSPKGNVKPALIQIAAEPAAAAADTGSKTQLVEVTRVVEIEKEVVRGATAPHDMTTAEAAELLGVSVQRLETEPGDAWIWRGAYEATEQARCPDEFVCTLATTSGVKVYEGNDSLAIEIHAGTFRYYPSYPQGDDVHLLCALLAKEISFGQKEGYEVGAGNFSCNIRGTLYSPEGAEPIAKTQAQSATTGLPARGDTTAMAAFLGNVPETSKVQWIEAEGGFFKVKVLDSSKAESFDAAKAFTTLTSAGWVVNTGNVDWKKEMVYEASLYPNPN